MKSAEVDKCIEYLNNNISGLTVKNGDAHSLSFTYTTMRWLPPDLSWWDWLVKYKADPNICGEDCYTIRVASRAIVANVYPFAIQITAAETIKTFAEFKERLQTAFELLTKAREQKAAYLAEWKKEQIEKAAGVFEV